MKQPTVIALGRFGDVTNALPAAYSLARKGARPRFVISKEFRSILDGVSYVDPVEFDGDYKLLPEAIESQKKEGFDPLVFQAYKHPDQKRFTNSYNQEAWRLAGVYPLFGAIPLIFDKRDKKREARLARHCFKTAKPKVLIALSGVSSPFPLAQELENLIDATCGAAHEIVDLCKIKAEKPYDLIGLIDRASLLVSIDTLHLHLARASSTPIISIVNDGWFGSFPPPQSVRTFRYQEARADLFQIGDAIESYLFAQKDHGRVVHAVHLFGKTDRHRRAQETWGSALRESTITNYRCDWYRTARAIGDKRPLPYLKDIFESALELASDDDCVVWMNDDVSLKPDSLEIVQKHVSLWNAVSVRRFEPGVEGVHMGRELIAFRAGWLRSNLKKIPDYIVGTEAFDLGLAAFIRNERGIASTFKNFSTDFFPCELPPGLAIHEPHESAWASFITSPANIHNRRLFREWAAVFQKALNFNSNNQVCP